jgi:hypothetical protein
MKEFGLLKNTGDVWDSLVVHRSKHSSVNQKTLTTSVITTLRKQAVMREQKF